VNGSDLQGASSSLYLHRRSPGRSQHFCTLVDYFVSFADLIFYTEFVAAVAVVVALKVIVFTV